MVCESSSNVGNSGIEASEATEEPSERKSKCSALHGGLQVLNGVDGGVRVSDLGIGTS